MPHLRFASFLVLYLILNFSCAYRHHSVSPLTRTNGPPKSIAIVQPKVAFFIKQHQRKKRQRAYDSEISRNVRDAMSEVFQGAGFKVVTMASSPDSIPEQVNADFLLLIDGWCFQRPLTPVSLIAEFNSIGFSNRQLHGIYLSTRLIDARNGKVVWKKRNHDIDSNYDPLHFADVEKFCHKLLSSLIPDQVTLANRAGYQLKNLP